MKKIKELNKVAVHNGNFHADDVFAIALLKIKNPKIKIIRTRNESILKEVDMRIDVGMKYDPQTYDFDHHQKDFNEIRINNIPYAAFGLVWKTFWKEFFNDEKLANNFDYKLVQPIDADDIGIELVKDYIIYPYTISKIISNFIPNWNEEKQDFDQAFNKAVDFAKIIILNEINKIESISKAETIVHQILKERNPNLEYIILNKYIPWKKFISYEKDKIKFVIYKTNDNWIATAVTKTNEQFKSVKNFPTNWGGLEKKKLRKISGVKDAIFCHKNLFICAAKTKDGILKMVQLALNN